MDILPNGIQIPHEEFQITKINQKLHILLGSVQTIKHRSTKLEIQPNGQNKNHSLHKGLNVSFLKGRK